MNAVDAVIFDLDGVLVSTDAYHYKAWKSLADDEGIYFDETINNRLRGVSRMACLDIILERASSSYTDEDKLRMADTKNERFRALLGQLTPDDIADGALETLALLKRRGVALAIGSSSKNAPLILERLGITGMFDVVSDGNNITRSKPDPEVFLKAAELLGVSPARCAVVEDAVSGIEAAKAAGMTAIAVKDARSSPLADYRMDGLKELPGIVFAGGDTI